MPDLRAVTPARTAAPAGGALEVSGEGQALLGLLFPQLAGLRVQRVEDTGDAVVISASSAAASACCPRCGSRSSRVHGGYQRLVADGAAGGRAVLVAVRVRRFRCRQRSCPAVTFAAQEEGLTSRYCRRSLPLTRMLTGFGLELAGRAGARLARRLGISVHPSTLLRLVLAAPEPEPGPAPAVLGVDDFALRKGHVYGTVLIDVETGQTVDLLPDRDAATLESWLKARPGAKVICRDRSGAYSEGARAGAPAAVQVADRWHLWHNLGEAAQKAVARHRGCLKARPAAGEEPGEETQALVTPEDAGEGRLARRTRERYAEIRERLDGGQTIAAVCRATGWDRKTVQRFSRAASIDELLVSAGTRESKLDPFKPWVCQRWNEGVTDAAVLHAELRQRGWTGSAKTVRRYVAPFRKALCAPDPVPAVPGTREITRWIMTRPDRLKPDDQAQLQDIRARCPHIDALARHTAAFAEIMTARTGSRDLEAWLAAVEADDLPELRSLASGMRSDQQAVVNGLSLPYSSGKVEGTVNKIKTVKRQMYGRASFTLLRKRVILHPA